ncbi:MAG: hypothetical protein H0U27_14220 [Nitrosopumilus sp.]|nr:hypothetical protein [Nitrosopumilus sp.]
MNHPTNKAINTEADHRNAVAIDSDLVNMVVGIAECLTSLDDRPINAKIIPISDHTQIPPMGSLDNHVTDIEDDYAEKAIKLATLNGHVTIRDWFKNSTTTAHMKAISKVIEFLIKNGPQAFEKEGSDMIRLPSIVDVITEGGRLNMEARLALGKYVNESLKALPKNYCRRWIKVPIVVSAFLDGSHITTTIQIIKYTRDDLADLAVAVSAYLVQHQPEIIY